MPTIRSGAGDPAKPHIGRLVKEDGEIIDAI
jgi:hypothetical protein